MQLIFDVDGTLTESGKEISDNVLQKLTELKQNHNILIIVGGGNYEKILWQIKNKYDLFDKIFANSGAELYVNNKLIYRKNFLNFCDRESLNNLLRMCLYEIANLDIMYHGGQFDFRSGLVYVSPPGIQASDYERNIFIQLDKQNNIRKKLIAKLKKYDLHDSFEILLGGSVGISIAPTGWNKGQILEHIGLDGTTHFFGDKTEPDGNDYPLYSNPKLIGHSVTNPIDLLDQLELLI